jgi:hypothetical protein
VRSKYKLKLLPRQRAALELRDDRVLMWRRHHDTLSIAEHSMCLGYSVELKASSHDDDFYLILNNRFPNTVSVYVSYNLADPLFKTAYDAATVPVLLVDTLYYVNEGGLRGVRLSDLSGIHLDEEPCYYHASRSGVIYEDQFANLTEAIVNVKRPSTLYARGSGICGTDLIPLFNFPRYRSHWYYSEPMDYHGFYSRSRSTDAETLHVVFLDAEEWRVTRAIKLHCQSLLGHIPADDRLVQLCLADDWEMIEAILPPDMRSDEQIRDLFAQRR